MDSLSAEVGCASAVLIVLDARCPFSSLNSYLEELFRQKPAIYILNKEDLASVKISREWLDYFKKREREAILVSCKTGVGKRKLLSALGRMRDDFLRRSKRKKYSQRLFRLAVVGVPNTGKSSIINLLSRNKTVKTGKKPGLTRGKQWLKIRPGTEILDSPGITMPRMDNPDTPWILGAAGVIKQEILPIEEVAGNFIRYLVINNLFPRALFPDGAELKSGKRLDSLQIYENGEIDPNPIIDNFARLRGFLAKGGGIDREKASLQILKIYREGKLGRISLERPDSGVTHF